MATDCMQVLRPVMGGLRRLLNDLKSDGYQPTAVETDTSEACHSKSVLIRVERYDDTDTDQQGADQ